MVSAGAQAMLLRLRVLVQAALEGARQGLKGWVEPQRAQRISLRQSCVTTPQLHPEVFPEGDARLQLLQGGRGSLLYEGGGRGKVEVSGLKGATLLSPPFTTMSSLRSWGRVSMCKNLMAIGGYKEAVYVARSGQCLERFPNSSAPGKGSS